MNIWAKVGNSARNGQSTRSPPPKIAQHHTVFSRCKARTYLYALAWLLWLAARLIMVSKQF